MISKLLFATVLGMILGAGTAMAECKEKHKAQSVKLDPEKLPELQQAKVEQVQKEFNQNSDKVRLLSILSPKCPYCVKGHKVVKDIFDKTLSNKLVGQVIWLPVVDGDNKDAARYEFSTSKDKRISHSWDGNSEIAKRFSKTLNVKGIAWDVYLIYEPGIEWNSSVPPKPTYWMHQLREKTGADQKLCLDEKQLQKRIKELVNKTPHA